MKLRQTQLHKNKKLDQEPICIFPVHHQLCSFPDFMLLHKEENSLSFLFSSARVTGYGQLQREVGVKMKNEIYIR